MKKNAGKQIMRDNSEIFSQKPLNRDQYLQIVEAAIHTERFHYARDMILKWLANYPGDLKAGIFYAKSLIGLGRKEQAITVLRGLCKADPEYVQAVEILLLTLSPLEDNIILDSDELTYLFVMTGKQEGLMSLAEWGMPLYSARQALENGNMQEAEQFINQVNNMSAPLALAAVTQLRILTSLEHVSTQQTKEIAERYYKAYPDCLACALIHADILMKTDKSDKAVALLHQVAARDISGQVVSRIWGVNHPYRSLWLEQIELSLDAPIPAIVASALGRNRLNQGEEPPILDVQEVKTTESEPIIASTKIEEQTAEIKDSSKIEKQRTSLSSQLNERLTGVDEKYENVENTKPTVIKTEQEKPIPPKKTKKVDKDISSIAEAFEKIALKVKLSGISHIDGRYPVYVVFSHRKQMEKTYGSKATAILDAEMWRLVEAVRNRQGWNARLFLADDPLCTQPLGIKPVESNDPWELKLALRDLDAALAKNGEQIGAVLIVGGPDIIPFHHLPNPINDQDQDIPSDNPYATRDNNYFLPEWIVGRLPGGAGKDANLILDTLRRISAYHTSFGESNSWMQRLKQMINQVIKSLRREKLQSFGYSAAVWKEAATEVFQVIGETEDLKVSPPMGLDKASLSSRANPMATNHGMKGIPYPDKELAFFNLHGVIDAAEWYGHANPLIASEGPDYPVAIRPIDLEPPNQNEEIDHPKFVLSEACYGINIFGKEIDQAMCLKFLQTGCLAVVGSTSMAYGSIGTPLIAADYLSSAFWRLLLQGLPVGEALRQAKIHLAEHVTTEHGFLDVEDQKTLISFNLYGDPLAQYVQKSRTPKVVKYLDEPLSDITTVSEGFDFIDGSQPMPANVLKSVKKVVKQYLPGMNNANLSYVHEHVRKKECYTHHSHHPKKKGKIFSSEKVERNDDHQVITLRNETKLFDRKHPTYARLTLNEEGDLVKLVISR